MRSFAFAVAYWVLSVFYATLGAIASIVALRSSTALMSPSRIISVAMRASDRPSAKRPSASSIWLTSILGASLPIGAASGRPRR